MSTTAPEPQNQGAISLADVEALINQRVSEATATLQAQHEQQMTEMETRHNAQIAAMSGGQAAPSPITEHGGGVGTDIASTWSQYEQELARYGEHPAQLAEQSA